MSQADLWFLMVPITLALILAIYAHVRIDRLEDNEKEVEFR